MRFFNATNNKNISNINVNINMNSTNCIDLNILHIVSKYQNACFNDSFTSVVHSSLKYILCHLRKYTRSCKRSKRTTSKNEK